MIENHPQEALLIGYVDGLATPEEKLRVQGLIKHDQSAADFLRQLEQTDGLLKDAAVIDMSVAPDAISRYVQDYELPDHPKEQSEVVALPTRRNQPIRQNKLTMVATLILGLIGGGFLSSTFKSTDTDTAQSHAESNLPEWVRLVADYHRLYDRVTISDNQPLTPATVSTELSEKLGRAITVPDLTAFGLEFMREQTLVYEDNPIVQLVYLPENSRPVAVCILAAKDAAERQVISGTHANMQFAYWQEEEHAVVVVGEISKQKLDALTKQVAGNLFSAS